MGTLSVTHWIIVATVVLLIFGGRGRISGIMSDVGKGIKSFRREVAKVREATTTAGP